MIDKQTGISKLNINDEPINIRAIALKYSSYWPLFLTCVLIAIGIATVYTKYATQKYEVTASLMIQDNNQQSNQPKSSLVEFQALEQVNAPKVVENEMEMLKSNQLIKGVVNNFQLWANYKLKGGIIKDKDLYGISPVKVNLVDPTNPVITQKINLKIVDSSSYELLDHNGGFSKHHFGDTVKKIDGAWTITTNANINRYFGDEVQIVISDPEGTVLSYQNAIKIEAQEKPATVINISLSDGNIKKAEDFINYLIYSYKKTDIAEKARITKSTLNFIDRRIDSLSGQLSHTENSIEGYRSQNGLTDINQQSQIYLQGIQANDEKLNDINTQLNVINRLNTYVNQPSNNNSDIPSTVGISDQHLADLVKQLSDIQLEKNKMLATLPEKNPAFEPINNQISALKQSVRDNISSIKSSLTTMQKSLESYKSTIQSSIKSVPLKEHQLQGMGRQQSTKSSLYDYLLQQRESISLTYASSTSEVRVVDAAHILPIKASKKIIPFAIAILMGLVFPAGFIYGRDLIRNQVTNRKQIEHITGAKVIAEISNIKLPSSIAFENKDNPESFPLIEQFRHLRTQVNLLNQSSTRGSVVLITSSVAGEGKSMVSANLAVSLASSGKKILLVETDIYKPVISKIFGLPPSKGITNYLTRQITMKDLIQQSASYDNLSIIGSGGFVDNFSELLEQNLYSEMVTKFREEYDFILFDTPPVHSVNDGYIVGKYCDATLYVVRYGYSSKSSLSFVSTLIGNKSLPVVNIVFNGLEKGRDGEGFKYENYYKQVKSKIN